MKEQLSFDFWGVRGTFPVSGKKFLEFGGNTVCTQVLGASEPLIVDAGTGIKRLGDRYRNKRGPGAWTFHLLLTHFHLDHILGLPHFFPIYLESTELHIYAPAPVEETENILDSLMGGMFFPLKFSQTPSRKIFHRIDSSPNVISEIEVTSFPLNHPQGSVAYGFRKGGRFIVTATDTEHPEKGVDSPLASFCAGADKLIYDTTFTPGEYEKRRKGWGHSTWKAGVELAQQAGVIELILSHHNPDHPDEKIRIIADSAKAVFPGSIPAREKKISISESQKEES